MTRCWLSLLAGVAGPLGIGAVTAPEGRIVVGSKAFTESRLLGELVTLLLEEHTELEVEHRAGLGGTLICHQALVNGELDLYPEYSGTGWAVVLKESERCTDPLRTFLEVQEGYRRRFDVQWSSPLGFENTYALAVRRQLAVELGLETLSDLAAHPELRAGFSHEFLNRADGYPGLSAHYGWSFEQVRGIEHGLAYEAIESGALDLIDAYSTDGRLLANDLVVLDDDRAFFPPYHAALLARSETLRDRPGVEAVLRRLAFRISAAQMTALNHAVDIEKRDFRDVAREFLEVEGLLAEPAASDAPRSATRLSAPDLAELVLEHLRLTLVSVLLAALVAVPVGVALSRRAHTARLVLGAASVLQTIPSLALLAVLIALPGFGLSERSALFALFLYALLPILRNTVTGMRDVDPDLIDAAEGIGLTPAQVLLRVQLPLATRSIMGGLRTASVISVGVATLAAFIGAGGLGEPIVTGLYLNDTRLILFGAIPAALLALGVDGLLALVERRVVPRGLRTAAGELPG